QLTAACIGMERLFLGLAPVGAKARPRKSLSPACLACVFCYLLLGHAIASPSSPPSSHVDPMQNVTTPQGTTLKKRHQSFGGLQSIYVHESESPQTTMEFAVFEPPAPAGT